MPDNYAMPAAAMAGATNRGASLQAVEASAIGVIEARLRRLVETNYTQNGRVSALIDALNGPEPAPPSPGQPEREPHSALDRVSSLIGQLEHAANQRENLVERLGRI